MSQRVTILTDASWCPDTGATGYGYWIASHRGKRPGGNVMRRAENPSHAEMMAVANALNVAVRAGLVCAGDRVLVQTDSTDAIAGLSGQRLRYESYTPAMEEVRLYVDTLAREHDLELEYRHVKGHTGRAEARYKANDHCDQRAKTFMRRARSAIRAGDIVRKDGKVDTGRQED